MIKANTLNVLVTNWCNAVCDHCCMNAGPYRKDSLSYQDIKNTVTNLQKHQPLRAVIFAGGEPMAKRDVLRKSIRHCTSIGLRTRLVTNAFWAKNFASARAVLEELREDGLVELNISCDDYHLPHVPVQNVMNAWKATKGLGFAAVVIANSTGPRSRINPGFITEMLGEAVHVRSSGDRPVQLRDVPKKNGTYYGISYSTFQRLERASELLPLDAYVPFDDSSCLRGPCPHAIRHPALSPRGHLLSCCGFELDGNEVHDLGSVQQENAQALVEKANQNDIVGAIAFLGPYFLMKVIEEIASDCMPSHKFGSVCEICRFVTTSPRMLQALREAPEQWIPALRAAQATSRASAA